MIDEDGRCDDPLCPTCSIDFPRHGETYQDWTARIGQAYRDAPSLHRDQATMHRSISSSVALLLGMLEGRPSVPVGEICRVLGLRESQVRHIVVAARKAGHAVHAGPRGTRTYVLRSA